MPDDHQPKPDLPATGDVWLGAALLGLAVVVMVLTPSIHSLGLGHNSDPGSRAFPFGLAVILGLGGLIEIGRGWPHRSGSRAGPASTMSSPARTRTALALLAGLGVYVLALPWLGFALSTLGLATAMMVWLGNSWRTSILTALVLIGVVYALFGVAFKVPLPDGVFPLPF